MLKTIFIMSFENVTDYCCCDCQESFTSASQLLTHFALHASQNESSAINSFVNETKSISLYDLFTKKPTNVDSGKSVPDLYPINNIKKGAIKNNLVKSNLEKLTDSFDDQSSYIKKCLDSLNDNNLEDFNPLNFCSVSIEEAKQNGGEAKRSPKKVENKGTKVCNTKKKYKCNVCSKAFGWSTDLKRHLLIHSGIRPFKCEICNATFTRNFLLQNHVNKKHKNSTKLNNMPNLKPILKNKTLKINKNFNVNLVKNEALVQ